MIKSSLIIILFFILSILFYGCGESEQPPQPPVDLRHSHQPTSTAPQPKLDSVYVSITEYTASQKGERPLKGAQAKTVTLNAVKTEKTPQIDGKTSAIWQKAPNIYVWDKIAKRNISLQALYTSTEIFILASFADATESIIHKSWQWNKNEQIYEISNIREDTFVIKWNMDSAPVDLSIFADNEYVADIWFWKACRTNPGGYADDKFQTLSFREKERSVPLVSHSGKTMYLQRSGDTGTAPYKSLFPLDYQSDIMPKYEKRTPAGSRGDVRAKGHWQNGRWTITFARKLNTHNPDDIQLTIGKDYLFGVSCLEIAGRRPNKKLSNPLYGSGDINNRIILKFKQ